jgi:hypothetical protein
LSIIKEERILVEWRKRQGKAEEHPVEEEVEHVTDTSEFELTKVYKKSLFVKRREQQ